MSRRLTPKDWVLILDCLTDAKHAWADDTQDEDYERLLDLISIAERKAKSILKVKFAEADSRSGNPIRRFRL